MSSCEIGRRIRPAALGLLAAVVLGGCTAGPLYGSSGQSTLAMTAPNPGLAQLAGRISVSDPNTRVDQIVRNPLIFRLNRGTPVANPLYEIRLTVIGGESGITVEPGGVAGSSIYRITAIYQLVRLSDGKTIGSGTRIATVPFDKTDQLYQQERALLNARKQAGDETAAQIELAIAKDLRG